MIRPAAPNFSGKWVSSAWISLATWFRINSKQQKTSQEGPKGAPRDVFFYFILFSQLYKLIYRLVALTAGPGVSLPDHALIL